LQPFKLEAEEGEPIGLSYREVEQGRVEIRPDIYGWRGCRGWRERVYQAAKVIHTYIQRRPQ